MYNKYIDFEMEVDKMMKINMATGSVVILSAFNKKD
ncbi:hypothetical protein J2Z44_003914 [Clostridium punense]|uniref:Uncharacterized protein n=1 Tax=Clostridium punense TaxID=1054297 RepID=A0ABS4KBS7_9CLOT|nr:hypothetical protein M918_12315 [Clostridium sp. BL8]MBP2024064.1 hypothetical protein [Clostridium punense]